MGCSVEPFHGYETDGPIIPTLFPEEKITDY
jgi:hypothetical protein